MTEMPEIDIVVSEKKQYGIVFDVETTGLPRGGDWKNNMHFNTCRLVSIGWEVIDMGKKEVLEKKHFYAKPKNFVIPENARNIHGISTEMARNLGENIEKILQHFISDIIKYNVDTIIAHNINFDMNVLCNELNRLGFLRTLNRIRRLEKVCTMKVGRQKMKLKKNPKLCDLYTMLTSKTMEKQHAADADTRACTECFFNLDLANSVKSNEESST